MKNFIFTLILCVILSCAKSKIINPVYPIAPLSESLQAEIERIRPLLFLCDGMIAKPSPNEITPRENCNTGNAFSYTGQFLTVAPNETMFQGIRDSFSSDGKPYRSPEHRRANDNLNEFSRDMVQGFLLSLTASRDLELLKRFWKFAKDNDFIICHGQEELEPSPHENLTTQSFTRCHLTPTVLYFIGDIFEYLGESRPIEAKMPDSVIEGVALYSAQANAPDFHLALIGDQVYLKILTGRLTNGWARVAKILTQRAPNNLWYRFLSNITHDGSESENEAIAKELLSKMQRFPAGLQDSWIWSQGEDENSMGWDLIFLAHRLKPFVP